tara:strand:+ start:1094 stop:1972 length:879 start_codon:yes stop_codon:yes gene_type:complete
MIARQVCAPLTIVILATAGCGADRSDVGSDDLAVAQQEIAQLKVLLAEQSEAADTEEPLDREVSGSPYSVGPCGVFALNGTRVVELSYELSEDGYIQDDPPPDWTETEIELPDGSTARSERLTPRRQPNVAFGVQLVPGLNHAWYFSWKGLQIPRPPRHLAGVAIWDEDLVSDKYNWGLKNVEWIGGNNVTSYSGFFGLDENCEWGWIKVNGVYGFIFNASIRLTEGENDEPEIATLRYKSYFCGSGDYYQLVYDSEEHNFVTQCPDSAQTPAGTSREESRKQVQRAGEPCC